MSKQNYETLKAGESGLIKTWSKGVAFEDQAKQQCPIFTLGKVQPLEVLS